jgi:hypothetical protein
VLVKNCTQSSFGTSGAAFLEDEDEDRGDADDRTPAAQARMIHSMGVSKASKKPNFFRRAAEACICGVVATTRRPGGFGIVRAAAHGVISSELME